MTPATGRNSVFHSVIFLAQNMVAVFSREILVVRIARVRTVGILANVAVQFQTEHPVGIVLFLMPLLGRKVRFLLGQAVGFEIGFEHYALILFSNSIITLTNCPLLAWVKSVVFNSPAVTILASHWSPTSIASPKESARS